MHVLSRKLEFFIVSFLYFAIFVVGYVFLCTDAEYNYNQQIARGFISKEAVFFCFDDPSYRTAQHVQLVLDPNEEQQESIVIDSRPKEAIDPTFVLSNRFLDNGYTAVESLLTSGSADYLASVHSGVMRGVAYKGSIVLPPLLSGRFFSEEECLSDTPLAVIGKKREDLVINRDGKRYLWYLNKMYEVIGIIGLSAESPMDDVIIVNLGSLTPEEQLNGTYYIDCSRDNEAIYNEMLSCSESLFGCGLKRRDIPTAFIDVVSGGMYMKTYLKVLLIMLGCITFISILIQSTRQKMLKIAVMKIQGIKLEKVFANTIKGFLTAFISGMIIGVLCNIGLLYFGVFSLPVIWMIQYCVSLLIAAILISLIWILTVLIVEYRLDPKTVIQKL